MGDPPGLIVVAQSARALACAAKRAGYAPLAIDVFGDDDTRALSRGSITLDGGLADGVRRAPVINAVRDFVRLYDAIGVVYGSGFEHQPEMVAELAGVARVYGVGSLNLARAKDPRAVARTCASAQVAHPDIVFEAPDDLAGWLTKSQGGAGGAHVRVATRESVSAGEYFQRRVEGRNVSALFVADGELAAIVGLSEQWTSPASRSPFRYGGAVGPIEVDALRAAEIERTVVVITREFGVVGLASVDFVVSDDAAWLIDINPRPGATLDVFDCDEDPLLARHIEACDGRATSPAARSIGKAAQVVYARADLSCPPRLEWPDWVADRPPGETRIAAGDPVCTVEAASPDAAAARRLVAERAHEIAAMIEGWAT